MFSFVAKLSSVDPVKGYENDCGKGKLEIYHFLTFFNETIVSHGLKNNELNFRNIINIETQVYEVMGAPYKKRPPSRFNELNLIDHSLMKFIGIAQSVAKPISSGEIFGDDFANNSVYGMGSSLVIFSL